MMPLTNVNRSVLARRPGLVVVTATLALGVALGWLGRDAAHARANAERVRSVTVPLGSVKMTDYEYGGAVVGKAGAYVEGETPRSAKFVTGRFILNSGKIPHPPHRHPEEEVMVIESGDGEILCDGKVTKVGPGSVMYTTPDAPHGITNTGTTPLVFTFIKWEAKPKAD